MNILNCSECGNTHNMKDMGISYFLYYIDCPKLAEIYLNNGIDINSTDIDGRNALFGKFNIKYIKFLVSKGINIYQLNKYGDTVLTYYIKFLNNNHEAKLDVIDLYLSYGLKINNEVLFNINKAYLLEYLLNKGLNVNIKNIFGNTILHNINLSIYKYEEKFIKLALKHFNDINIKNDLGNTILHNICEKLCDYSEYSEYENFVTISYMLINEYKADINILNNENLTAYDILINNKSIIIDDYDIIILYTEIKSNTKSSNKTTNV